MDPLHTNPELRLSEMYLITFINESARQGLLAQEEPGKITL